MQLARGVPRSGEMLHDRTAEREVDHAVSEWQAMDVADDVDVRVEMEVHANDARVVERLPSGAEVEGHLGVGQRTKDHPLLPR